MKPISDEDYQDVMMKIGVFEDAVQDLDIEGFAIRIGAHLIVTPFVHTKLWLKSLKGEGNKRLVRLHRMAYHLNKFKKLAKKDIEIMEKINSDAKIQK